MTDSARATKITDPNSGNTYLTYDPASNLLTLKDSVGQHNHLVVRRPEQADHRDQRAQLQLAAICTTRSATWSARTDRNSRVRVWTYDQLNRMTAEDWY